MEIPPKIKMQDINLLLQKFKYNDEKAQYSILKNIAASIHNANRNGLLCLLDVMNTTRNIDLQVQIVSVFCGYLLSSDANIDIFIKCSYMYASIDNILTKNLPRKTTVVLNFFTLLLHADCEDFASRKLNLVTHARNMIRNSGCLAAMTDVFTRGMMHQDTWKALCQCLTETCSGCEINQSYCTHLIPKCVLRCSQGNMDPFALLLSLLYNHKPNIEMFIQTNGMCLFTRNLLQYSLCLQLLDTVIQTSTQAAIISRNSNIIINLREILRSHGPYSQMGQWATVILYHADSIIKETREQIDQNIETKEANESHKNELCMDHSPHYNNTTQLFHNVIKEIIHWQPTAAISHKSPITLENKKERCKPRYNIRMNQKGLFDDHSHFQKSVNIGNTTGLTFQPKRKTQENKGGDLSFTFLQELKKNLKFNDKNNFSTKETTNDSPYNFSQYIDIDGTTRQQSINFSLKNKQFDMSIASIQNFKPDFTSTPKKKMGVKSRASGRSRENIKINEFSMQETKTNRANKFNSNKGQKNTMLKKDLKNKSFSVRLLNILNDSYITVVNRVKDIFKSNNDTSKIKRSISPSKYKVEQEDLCNYSFTEYMRIRDVHLAGDRNSSKSVSCSNKNVSITVGLCKTCDDTLELKQKMVNDKYLRQAVQKLKLGINVYGCDFKKISKVMWPRESYMTPEVLYNLYRKLIIK